MKRAFVLSIVAVAAAAVGLTARSVPEAHAVAPSQIVGAYKLTLKGDGWLRGKTDPYRVERIGGKATMVLTRNVPDDGKLHVAIELGSSMADGLVDVATPTPDFSGTGYLVGDSMTVIGTGAATYVNAITFTFLKGGSKLIGHWMASLPPSDSDPTGSAASAVGIDFTGRRLTKRDAAVDLAPRAIR